MRVYGLFNYVYDYYEWEDFVVSSLSIGKLVDYAAQRHIYIADSDKQHAECASQEIAHAMIKELELI